MSETKRVKERILAIDLLRGITIAAMVLVNNPGSWGILYNPEGIWRYIFWPLRHANWHGMTPTDLIFPFFLFLSGASAWFSFRRPAPFSKRLKGIVLRSAELFLIGVFLVNFPFNDSAGALFHKPFAEWRIMGVLQRIALAWGIGAILIALWGKKPRLLALLSAVILFGYWGALHFCGVAGADPYSVYNHLGHRIDLAVLGSSHLWSLPNPPYEPEGLLGSLPAVVTVILGWFAGRFIGTRGTTGRGSWLPAQINLVLWGTLLTVAGLIWNVSFPANKALWSSSYVLISGGIGFLVLSLFVWLFEEQGWRKHVWIIQVFGTNALLLYILDQVWVKSSWFLPSPTGDGSFSSWLYSGLCVPLCGPHGGSLLFPILHLLLYWILLYPLFKRKIFLKL